jgi:hypothetical protein
MRIAIAMRELDQPIRVLPVATDRKVEVVAPVAIDLKVPVPPVVQEATDRKGVVLLAADLLTMAREGAVPVREDHHTVVAVDHPLEVVADVQAAEDFPAEDPVLGDLVVLLRLQWIHWHRSQRKKSTARRRISRSLIVTMNGISRSSGRISIVRIQYPRKSISWKSSRFPILPRR